MFQIGDLVYYGKLKEMGVVVDILHRAEIYKYKVHFLETNFVWTYDKDELTRIEDAI
jgi:hypothetical protein